jgi:hypothetical protein
VIHTTLTPMISPLVFLTFFNFLEAASIPLRGLFTPGAPQEIPKTRLRNDLVRCEDAHAVDFRSWVRLGGQVAADDLEFLKTHSVEKVNQSKLDRVRHPKSKTSIHLFFPVVAPQKIGQGCLEPSSRFESEIERLTLSRIGRLRMVDAQSWWICVD